MAQRISTKRIADLTKMAEGLEAQMWAKVRPEKFPYQDQMVKHYDSVWPFTEHVWHKWLSENPASKRLNDRRGQIADSLLPIHPAFLPYEHEEVRKIQWALHRSEGYRSVLTELHSRYVTEAIPRYNVDSIGMLQIALDLFSQQIDEAIADHEYMKVQTSREALAASLIEFQRIFARLREAESCAKCPIPPEQLERIYNHASIEYLSRNRGYQVTEEEMLTVSKMYGQLTKDRKAGKPASESEAVQYLREMIERYPGRAIDFNLYEPGKRLSRY